MLQNSILILNIQYYHHSSNDKTNCSSGNVTQTGPFTGLSPRISVLPYQLSFYSHSIYTV